MTTPSRPHILGVAGGSGSGKTYFSNALHRTLGPERCQIVYQDDFYFDQSERFERDPDSVNFDHPDSLDFDSLARCLRELCGGQRTRGPRYDFATHKRAPEPQAIEPKPIIIVEGILIFHSPQVRALCDERVFFDTPESLRLERRLHRDVHERARAREEVLKQYTTQVKPMHDRFVEPSRVHATTVVTDLGTFDSALEEFTRRLAARS